jgi:hypothetical protein
MGESVLKQMTNGLLIFLGYLAAWILMELGVMVYALISQHDLVVMFVFGCFAAILLGLYALVIIAIEPLRTWNESPQTLIRTQKLLVKK